MGLTILIIITVLFLILGLLGIVGSVDFEDGLGFYILTFLGVIGIFLVINSLGGGIITHIFFALLFVVLTIGSLILLIGSLTESDTYKRSDMAGLYTVATVIFGIISFFVVKSLF